ncbi:MAG: lysoplasmalogenase [Defluviitaleaceae bacterium]|nr:lysoplasmalogenase [Defluviitaleaceae bacterium]
MTNDTIKFIAMLICFGIAIAGRNNAVSKRDYALLVTAMAATVVADYFLVIVYDYPVGVAFFCAVQVLYNVRFGGMRRLRILPIALIAPIIFLFVDGDVLITIAILYAQLFLLSYIAMIQALRKGAFPAPNNVLVFIGMTAFVLCDICVAIWNLGRFGIITNTDFVGFAHRAIWLFYTPAQICLALSGRKYITARFERIDSYS